MDKIEITPEFLDNLKAKAEKATPGPWLRCALEPLIINYSNEDPTKIIAAVAEWDDVGKLESVYDNADNNAEYVATVNPQVVLALIGRIEELEANNYGPEILNDPQALTVSYFAGRMAEGRENNAEIDRLNAENTRLKVELHDMDISAAEARKEYRAEIAKLEKEADWLATELAKFCSREDCENCEHSGRQWEEYCFCKILSLGVNSLQTWREAARKAVEEQCQ